jgi:hypothetical protein
VNPFWVFDPLNVFRLASQGGEYARAHIALAVLAVLVDDDGAMLVDESGAALACGALLIDADGAVLTS